MVKTEESLSRHCGKLTKSMDASRNLTHAEREPKSQPLVDWPASQHSESQGRLRQLWQNPARTCDCACMCVCAYGLYSAYNCWGRVRYVSRFICQCWNTYRFLYIRQLLTYTFSAFASLVFWIGLTSLLTYLNKCFEWKILFNGSWKIARLPNLVNVCMCVSVMSMAFMDTLLSCFKSQDSFISVPLLRYMTCLNAVVRCITFGSRII